MGLGIAYVAAVRARLPVLIHDKSKEQLNKSLKLMDKLLEKDVNKGKLQRNDATEARERLTIVDNISGFRNVDMCIEVSSSSVFPSDQLITLANVGSFGELQSETTVVCFFSERA